MSNVNAFGGCDWLPGPTRLLPPELARYVEERGYDSFWMPEHTHMPASGADDHPADAEVAWIYRAFYDPFVSLGAVAAATA